MSVGKSENRFHEILEISYPNYLEKETGISKAIIPFSKMFQSHRPTDVYCGKEKIPFRERDPEYKVILRQEFSDLFR